MPAVRHKMAKKRPLLAAESVPEVGEIGVGWPV